MHHSLTLVTPLSDFWLSQRKVVDHSELLIASRQRFEWWWLVLPWPLTWVFGCCTGCNAAFSSSNDVGWYDYSWNCEVYIFFSNKAYCIYWTMKGFWRRFPIDHTLCKHVGTVVSSTKPLKISSSYIFDDLTQRTVSLCISAMMSSVLYVSINQFLTLKYVLSTPLTTRCDHFPLERSVSLWRRLQTSSWSTKTAAWRCLHEFQYYHTRS